MKANFIKAPGGSLLQREAKRESKKRLAILLQQLAFYVNRIADGDLTILFRSGFPVFTGRKKGLSPDTPGLPVLKDSILSGDAILSFQPVGRDKDQRQEYKCAGDTGRICIIIQTRVLRHLAG